MDATLTKGNATRMTHDVIITCLLSSDSRGWTLGGRKAQPPARTLETKVRDN